MISVPSSALVAIAIFVAGVIGSYITTRLNNRARSQSAYMDRLAEDNRDLRRIVDNQDTRIRKLENQLLSHGFPVPERD